jgi:hypothetical protein
MPLLFIAIDTPLRLLIIDIDITPLMPLTLFIDIDYAIIDIIIDIDY